MTVKELKCALNGLSDDCRIVLSVEDDNEPIPITYEVGAIGAIIGPGILRIMGSAYFERCIGPAE